MWLLQQQRHWRSARDRSAPARYGQGVRTTFGTETPALLRLFLPCLPPVPQISTRFEARWGFDVRSGRPTEAHARFEWLPLLSE